MVTKQTFVCNFLKSVGIEFGFKCGDFLVQFTNAFQNYTNPVRTGGEVSQNCRRLMYSKSGFSQMYKIGIIANFAIPHICRFFPYLHLMLLANMKLDVSWYERIIFQVCLLHRSNSFLMAQLKQS